MRPQRGDDMKKSLIGIVTTAVLCWCSVAHAYSAFFRYDVGTRIDYSKSHPQGEESADSMPKNTLLHISTNPDGKTAKISITYGKNQNDYQQDQEWTAFIVNQSEDMISLMSIFGDDASKIDQYVIYPKHGTGFTVSHSAYLGNPLFKFMKQEDDTFPYGTVMLFKIKQFKE